jgi:hypothetical protein
MERRRLAFTDFAEVNAELERLRDRGYQQAGKWDLAQTCDHLSYFIKDSLDGATYRVPWLLHVLFGRIALRRILSAQRMKTGVPTPQKPLPAPGGDASAAVARLQRLIERLNAHQGDLHPSPFFGYLTPAQWRQLHLIHCAHHLGFLVPI